MPLKCQWFITVHTTSSINIYRNLNFPRLFSSSVLAYSKQGAFFTADCLSAAGRASYCSLCFQPAPHFFYFCTPRAPWSIFGHESRTTDAGVTEPLQHFFCSCTKSGKKWWKASTDGSVLTSHPPKAMKRYFYAELFNLLAIPQWCGGAK